MARGALIRAFILAALAAAFTACSEPATAPSVDESKPPLTEENNPDPPPQQDGLALIQCAKADFDFKWALLGPLGGLLSLDGHSLLIPSGSLLNLALITLKQPATTFVEVDVRVNFRPHFQFAKPVTLTLDYSRCDASEIGEGPVSVVEINPFTKAILREVGGVDNRDAERISFETDHFSGYAVAQ
jgi:hypothetical protein